MGQMHNTFMQEDTNNEKDLNNKFNNSENRSSTYNILIKLLKKFPDEKWDYESLAKNPNINMEFVKNNLNKFRTWHFEYHLSYNLGITIEDIKNNPQFNWNSKALEFRQIDYLKKEIDYFANDMYSIKHTISNLDDYNICNVSLEKGISKITYGNGPITDLEDYRHNIISQVDLSEENPIIQKQPEPSYVKPINYSTTRSIPKSFVYQLSKFKGDLLFASKSSNLISNLPIIHFNKYLFYSDFNLSLKLIKKNIDKPWDWYDVARNYNLNMKFILLTKDKYDKQDWYSISYNANITWEDINRHPELPWDWYGVSRNPNLTYEIIIDNPKLQNFYTLSCNYFQKSSILINQTKKRIDRKLKYWKYIMKMIFIY